MFQKIPDVSFCTLESGVQANHLGSCRNAGRAFEVCVAAKVLINLKWCYHG
jgi:hypothetical protein